MKVLFPLFVLILFVVPILCDNGGILQIHYPDISIEADKNGNVTLKSGADASVYLVPGPGASVYYDGVDLLQLIDVINGLPPVWKDHSSVGFFHTAFGGETVNIPLEAVDPDNNTMDYRVVAGTAPPGIRVDSARAMITGVVPDVDAMYSFTVRATNQNDKYADAVFRMEIIEQNQCLSSRSPCRNGGVCIDMTGDIPYRCNCTENYSGQNCQTACKTSSLGVSNSSRVPDAMMSGFLTRDNFTAAEGRLDTRNKGWCGSNANSWLQVDLGRDARVFSATEQSFDGTYYTGSYFLSYSRNGFNFTFVQDPSTNSTADMVFGGSSSSAKSTVLLPVPVTARFVRFHPISYTSSQYPCMKVDLSGCYIE